MKIVLLKNAVAMVVCCICATVTAEYRIWEDTSGKTMDAEYVTSVDGKVVLRKTDGSEIRVSLDSLCENDQRYVMLKQPPSMEIAVSTKVDRENTGQGGDFRRDNFQVQAETIQVDVAFRKKSTKPYGAELKAEIYVIGQRERDGSYIILDLTKSTFVFTPENKNLHTVSSPNINLKQLEGGRQFGLEYRGYLVAVKDVSGQVVSMKCSKLDFEKNAAVILACVRGDMLSNDFKPVEKKEGDNRSSSDGTNYKQRVPGRRF